MASVGFVLAHYYDAYLLPTLRTVERLDAALNPIRSVFVANHDAVHQSLMGIRGDRKDSCDVLRHDNSDQEFGAYQAGVDRLLDRVDTDWIVIANDTCGTHSNFARVYSDKLVATLAHPREHPVIVGRGHVLPRSYELAGLRTHRWIQTNLFAINRAALHALGMRIFRPETAALVTGSSKVSEFFSDEVDQVLRHHLEMWLFGMRPGPRWYGAEPLRPENAAKMARKARSILHEMHLSAALEASGAEFVDLNQLSFAERLSKRIDDRLFDSATRRSAAAYGFAKR